jgi:anti-sigma-K factor RskA
MSAEACPDLTRGAVTVSPLLKARVMQQVRRDAEAPPKRARRSRTIVWPAYLVAAACFAVALYSSLMNLSLMQQLKSEQSQLAQVEHRSTALAQNLATERETIADLTSDRAQRFNVAQGQIVRVNHRLYLTLHDMPAPEHGKVYQAWTLPKGSKVMEPSVTFVPDAHGAAVIALPQNADQTTAVAISVEPQGGSKQPTSKPLVVQSLV